MPATNHPDQITLSEYITARWKQLGVKHIFGCPGDFNLEVSTDARVDLTSHADGVVQFLDYIEKDPALEWVGDGE